MATGLLLSASQKLVDALFRESAYLHDDRKPSSRTRSSGHARVHIKMHDESAREHERERVQNFAHALGSIPMCDGDAIHRMKGFSLASPNVQWKPHGSGNSLLEHHNLLPRLHSVRDDDAAVPLHHLYAQQLDLRRHGNSYALWQMAEAGAVTLPHVDDDQNGVTMGTYLAVVEGAQLIIAWRRDELHEDKVLDAVKGPVPSLDLLNKEKVPSLTILRAVAGDLIYMPRNTVHMVVTEERKVHLAFHLYEDAAASKKAERTGAEATPMGAARPAVT